MSGNQALVVALIALAATVMALVLVSGLWSLGLRALERASTRWASFELIVALRHLRGRKSGYLRAMTVVVLLAMTMVNCSLPTVLSVMGGFGNDLKQKILEATAHVIVDLERPDLSTPPAPGPEDLDRLAERLGQFPELAVVVSAPTRAEAGEVARALEQRGVEGRRIEIRALRGGAARGVRVSPTTDDRTIAGYGELADRISPLRGVVGVTPFIDADVMLASQTNIASVVLKGVDPATMDRVIGLRRTIEQGEVEYLGAPERIMEDVLAEQERRLRLLLAEAGVDLEPEEPLPEAGPPVGLDGGRPDAGAGEAAGRGPVGDDGGLEHPGPARGESFTNAGPEGAARDDEVLPAVVVGRELAKTLRVFVGDEVNVVSPLGGIGPMGPIPKARRFRVGGVFYSGMYQDDAKNAYVRLDVAQGFLGLEGRASGLRVRVAELEEADLVATAIRRDLGRHYRVRPWQEVNANLFSALRLEKIAMFAVYLVFFIICAFLIASTLTMMVLEKRRGLAVLKTLGASNLRLGAVFMLQGLLAGVVGTIAGQATGVSFCLALGSFVAIDPDVYYIDRLPVSIEPAEFAMVAVAGLLTAVVATLLPLAATVVLRPVDGLRQ